MDQTWVGTWGWIALALVNAGLAEQKNRSRLTWFLASLVLGPLATAWIVIMPPALEPVVSPSSHQDDEPGVALLVGGITIVLISALPAIGAIAGGLWALWVVTAVGVAVGAALIVLHVLTGRRWRAQQHARSVSRPTSPTSDARV